MKIADLPMAVVPGGPSNWDLYQSAFHDRYLKTAAWDCGMCPSLRSAASGRN